MFDDEIPMKIKKYNNWIEDCINKKNGKPHSLDSLIASGYSQRERSHFLPSRNLSIQRTYFHGANSKTNKFEWLSQRRDVVWN